VRGLSWAAGFEISRDAGRTERMAADPDFHAKPLCPALDHAPGVDPVHQLVRQRAGATDGGAEEGNFTTVADPGRLYIGIEIGCEGHHADRRPVAQPDHGRGVDAVQQLPGRLGILTVVLPAFTTCFGTRTACAGLVATTWPVTSQSNSMRMAARCCFTVGFSNNWLRVSTGVGGGRYSSIEMMGNRSQIRCIS
jgi:hypothetical protein